MNFSTKSGAYLPKINIANCRLLSNEQNKEMVESVSMISSISSEVRQKIFRFGSAHLRREKGHPQQGNHQQRNKDT